MRGLNAALTGLTCWQVRPAGHRQLGHRLQHGRRPGSVRGHHLLRQVDQRPDLHAPADPGALAEADPEQSAADPEQIVAGLGVNSFFNVWASRRYSSARSQCPIVMGTVRFAMTFLVCLFCSLRRRSVLQLRLIYAVGSRSNSEIVFVLRVAPACLICCSLCSRVLSIVTCCGSEG